MNRAALSLNYICSAWLRMRARRTPEGRSARDSLLTVPSTENIHQLTVKRITLLVRTPDLPSFTNLSMKLAYLFFFSPLHPPSLPVRSSLQSQYSTMTHLPPLRDPVSDPGSVRLTSHPAWVTSAQQSRTSEKSCGLSLFCDSWRQMRDATWADAGGFSAGKGAPASLDPYRCWALFGAIALRSLAPAKTIMR